MDTLAARCQRLPDLRGPGPSSHCGLGRPPHRHRKVQVMLANAKERREATVELAATEDLHRWAKDSDMPLVWRKAINAQLRYRGEDYVTFR
jgi:hypothetical protein